jgi:hypothetical protein
MKLFFKKLLLILFPVICCIGIIYIYKVYKIKHFDWRLPENITTIFMGASQPKSAINPNFYNDSINIASDSERYLHTYLKLEKLIENNKQIKEVFLQFSPTDIWKDADGKYYFFNDMKQFIPIYSLFFSLEEYGVYKNHFLQFLKCTIMKVYKGIPNSLASYGGFFYYDMEFRKNEINEERYVVYNNEGNSINYKYLRKIINECHNNGIKLYFVYFPMLDADSFFDQNYFFDAYEKYFSEVQLLNFRDFDIPDSFRRDEMHLNGKGAEYFTKYLFDYIGQIKHGNY